MVRSTVSIVIPIYNEFEILPELTRRVALLIAENNEYIWEIIYVDDGSTDGSTPLMEDLAERFPWLSVIFLSRNFGHQNATTAGIDHATGDVVVLMDGDLQDPPELILDMLLKWRQGFDVVYATRRSRYGETKFKLYTARFFYRILQKLSDTRIPVDTGDFRLMSRKAVEAIHQMPEQNRFLRGMASWIGFKQTAVYYERDKRYSGKTKFTFSKMFRFALNGLVSFSHSPLYSILVLGIVLTCIGLSGFIVLLFKAVISNTSISGWAGAITTILFVGGIQLISIGVIGEYVSRIFDEVRKRPFYLVRNIKGHFVEESESKLSKAFIARTGTGG
ncbi:MAG TPA: glycosyltransferase family 2 protein [Acidobacteriota bacterium]|nr:glycosyltransferase family 2 protein [Acidobacteriota bacterium]